MYLVIIAPFLQKSPALQVVFSKLSIILMLESVNLQITRLAKYYK